MQNQSASLVILLMIDGLRPDALLLANTPNLDHFRQRASWTLNASSVMPSITLPCHTSIFHSVPPSRHGIVTNNWQPMARPLPGFIDLAHAAGRRCAMIYNWEPLRDVSRPGNLHYSWFVNKSYETDGDDEVATEALRCLQNETPDFMFIYQGTVDVWGHNHGWMSDEYIAQIGVVDTFVGRILATLPETATVLIQADHGGHERTHGTDMPEDMTIPWMIAGPEIRQDYEIQHPVSLLDTAPTLARLLSINPDQNWEGRCIDEVFLA
ncbi:alkaline phosphatase family protein [Chloroflexi bacterium TSY]|nr:alkaline phosphatase family protein [Chloroflexi bacterium TSY]